MAKIAGAGGGGGRRKPQPKEAAQRARVEAAKELLVGQPWLVPRPPPRAPKPVPSVVKGAVAWQSPKTPPSKARPYTLAEQDAAAQRVLVAESGANQARARRQVFESMSPAERAARRRMPAPPSGTPGPREPPGLFLLKREREAQRAQEAGLGPSFDPTRYPIQAVQAAGELAKAGGMFGAKQLLGMAGSAAGAYQGVEGMRGGGPQWGASGRAIDPRVANLAEIPLATSVWKAYPKILVAGGSALALPFTEGPYPATKAWLKNGYDILRGTTQLAGFAVALPEMKPSERRQAFSGLFDAMVQYYSAYSDMSIREAAQRGQDQPVNSVLDMFAAMDPVGGAVGDLTAEQLGLVSSLYKKGFSLRRSLDQVRELKLAGPEGGGTIIVRKPLPQGGITRQAARLYDVGSRAIDRPVFRNKPIVKNLTETGRAARELTKQQNREKLRRMAEAHALFRDVSTLTHGRFGKLNAAEAERLTTLMGAPEGMNADEFLISVAEDYRRMLGGREFDKPAEQLSAGEARALSRYKRLQAEADRARIRQRGRSITNIAAEQERLATALADINRRRVDVRNQSEFRGAPGFEHLGSDDLRLESAKLQRQWDKLIEEVRKQHTIDKSDVARLRNASVKLNRRGIRTSTLVEQARALAEEYILDAIKRNPDDPRVRGLVAHLERLDAIHKEIARRSDLALGLDQPTLTPEAVAGRLSPDEVASRLRTLDSQAETVRAELDNVSVEEAPVQSAARDMFEQQLRDHPNITAEQAQDYLRVGDAAARATANRSGESPGAYWENLAARRAVHPSEGRALPQRLYDGGRDVRVTTEHTRAGSGYAAALGGRERSWLRVRRPGGPGLVRFTELHAPDEHGAFLQALGRNALPENLSAHDLEHLAQSRVFLSEDGHTGFMVTREGDLQNVFNNPGGIRGAGRDAIDLGLAHGAQTLDAYDGFLTNLYRQHGFEVSGRMAFSDEFAPAGWDYEARGRPDIVFMSRRAAPVDEVPYFTDWDAAKAHAASQVDIHPLAPTRRGDLLGASRFLAGPDGERIVSLTQQADITTLIDELIGHGVNEMKRYFPEEFSAVEELRGRPLEEWTADDHEWFSSMSRRYFASGDAPTPELVNTFTRLKSWLRSIYGALKIKMGGQIPVEVRDMLDAYLGGYDEPTVSRITMQMGPESAFSEEEAAFGAAAGARKDYEAIQKSNETRRAKASHEGKVARLEELQGKSDLTDAEEAEIETLDAEVTQEEARRQVRASRREMNLNRKLENLTKALEDTKANAETRDSALQSMIDIADDRENIMRMVFGDHYDEVFTNRKDLIADYLVRQGLLQPDFATGTAHYFPMTVKNPNLGQRLKMKTPSIGLTSKVIGKMKQDQLNLHHRNNMILWQNGDWNADPAVLLEAHQRAQAYRWGHEIKNLLWELGRPLNEGEIGGTTPLGDVIFINKDGTPIGPMFRKALDEAGNSGSAVHDVHNFLNGADGPDNEAALNSLRRYVESFAIDPEKGLPEGFTLDNPSLRVLPRELVEQLTPPIRGSRTLGGRAVDTVATLSRWALIYANIPGYMIVNGTGNLGFLVAQQGPWLLNTLVRNGHLLVTDRKLFDMITAETGELPLLIGQRGRGGIASIQTLQQKALSKISAVDRYPRAVAWMYEARKRGYKTGAQMRALIESDSAKAIADREAISNKARNHMVDFDRLTPFEREQVTRLIFVYPWIRGATAWPFWYAKEYPLRSAVTAAAAQSLEERRQKMLGPVPPWYEGLFPLGTEGTRARTINAAPFSPTATALQSAELLSDTIASLLGRKPDNVTAQLVDAVAPFYRTMVQAGTGRDQFGKAVSLQDTLKGTLGSMVPGWRLGAALINPDSAPRIYTEATRWRQFERTILRMGPSEISIPRLNAQAPVKTKPVSVQIEEEVAAAEKALAKLAPGTHFDQKMRRSTVIRVTYEAQKTELQRQASRSREWDPKKLESGQYERVPDLTPAADAHLLYITVKRFLPGLTTDELPPPEQVLREAGFERGSFTGRKLLERYRQVVYDAYAPTAAMIVRKGKTLEEAKKAGVG